jgi:hypothetical protein
MKKKKEKKKKRTRTTKPAENVPEARENVPKLGSSPQAPRSPMSNMDGKVTTSTGAALATGKRVNPRRGLPFTHSNNGMPKTTVIHPKSTKQLDKAPTVPSTPVLNEPLVVDVAVRVLVHSLEDFITS